MAKFTHQDIKGVIPPLPTAFTDDGKLDLEAQKRIVNHVLGPNKELYVDGVFVCSRTGEFPWLNYNEKMELLDVTLDAVNGRVPVLFGATGDSLKETIKLGKYAEKQGADAIVVAPFLLHDSNRGLPDIIVAVDGEVGLPDYIYNNPEFGKCGPRGKVRNIIPDVFGKSLERAKKLWGIKDSSGNLNLFRKYQEEIDEHKPGATAFIGDESMMIHSENSVPSYAVFDPARCKRLKNTRVKCKVEAAGIQEFVNNSHEVLYCKMKKIRGGLKYALSFIGLCGSYCKEPGQKLNDSEKQAIKNFMKRNYQHFLKVREYV